MLLCSENGMGTHEDGGICGVSSSDPDRYAVGRIVIGGISVTGDRAGGGIYCVRSEESVDQNT